MARSFYTKENGLEHLSDQDNCAARSMAFRLRRDLIDSKRNISDKLKKRIFIYYKSIEYCNRYKDIWSSSYKYIKETYKTLDPIDLKYSSEIQFYIKKMRKGIEVGKGLSKTKAR